jgi:hypothetical protein
MEEADGVMTNYIIKLASYWQRKKIVRTDQAEFQDPVRTRTGFFLHAHFKHFEIVIHKEEIVELGYRHQSIWIVDPHNSVAGRYTSGIIPEDPYRPDFTKRIEKSLQVFRSSAAVQIGDGDSHRKIV